MRGLLVVVLAQLCLVAACDSRAKANDPSGDKPRVLSKEYESCAASDDCENPDKIRCLDQMCRRTARSIVGDYYGAVGAAARARGDAEAAVSAYGQALGHYDSEKIPLPPDVACAYGGALALGRTTGDNAEHGAKVLHQCLLDVPAGTALRAFALSDLATLNDAGLDPLALGGGKIADKYMKLPAAPPPSKDKAVTVTAAPASATTQPYTDKVGAPELHNAIVACAEAYTAATKKDTLVTTIGIKTVYFASQYDDEQGGFSFALDPATGAPGAEGTAETCVRQAVEAALKAVPIKGQVASKLTITVK